MKHNPKKIQDGLIQLGLTQKEASVYYWLLVQGRSSVSQVSRSAGVNRATGYVILDSLINKGLARISGQKPRQEYIAENPERLIDLCKEAQQEAKLKENLAEELTLELKPIQKTGTRPQVRFYEGVKGIKTVFEDSLTAQSGNIIAFTSIEDQHASIPNYFPEYYQRRKEKKIFMRSIFPDTPMGKTRQQENKNEYRDSVLVSAEIYGIHPAINVYDDKLMIASFREELGIIIASDEIAEAMKKIFELAWIGAHSLETGTK